MLSRNEKKQEIRQLIIESAQIYSNELAGKTFLYVYGNEYFEVSFPTDHFMHLTGVESPLSAKNFYKRAKKGQLTDKQFYFSARYPFANAKKKLPSLVRIPELTKTMVCILKDMTTSTIVYKLSISNLEFTLGLTENIDGDGKKITDYFLPMSLRVEDTSVEKSDGGDIVDFIFSKEASVNKYDHITFKDDDKTVPEEIKSLLTDELIEELVKAD